MNGQDALCQIDSNRYDGHGLPLRKQVNETLRYSSWHQVAVCRNRAASFGRGSLFHSVRRTTQYLLLFSFALIVTTSAGAGEVVADDVFVRAAEQMRQTIISTGTDHAALLVKQCYLLANEQETEFGPAHATCATQDYLLTAVLALPFDRASWWPPYNPANRYDILAPALQSRIVNMHLLLNTPAEIIDDARRKMFFIAAKAFK